MHTKHPAADLSATVSPSQPQLHSLDKSVVDAMNGGWLVVTEAKQFIMDFSCSFGTNPNTPVPTAPTTLLCSASKHEKTEMLDPIWAF